MALDPAKLRTLELYAKRKALAEGTGDANERATALRQVQQMEQEDPGLQSLASKVEAAMNPSPFKGFGDSYPPPGTPFQDAVRNLASVFAQPVADRLAHEARSMVDMPTPLALNYKVTPLPAPDGEERVEVRWSRRGQPEKLEKLVNHLERRILRGVQEG